MKIWVFLTGFFTLALSTSAFAQSANLNKAVNGWLNGPEASNLQSLSKLAKSGESSAQLLLGQIDRDTPPGGFSSHLSGMQRDQRNNLLRAPKTEKSLAASTRNWLLNMSNTSYDEVGTAIFGYRVSRDVIGNAIAMQKHSEAAAAEYLLWETLMGGRFDLVNSMPSKNYGLAQAGFMDWIKTYMGRKDKSLTMQRLVNDPSSDMISGLLGINRLARLLGLKQNFSDQTQHFIMIAQGKGYNLPDTANLISLNADMVRIADKNAPLSLVTRACAKCSQGKEDYDCAIQALEIVGGYKALLRVRTPVESVIPASAYIESDRALETFENMLKSRSRFYKRPIRSICLSNLLKRES